MRERSYANYREFVACRGLAMYKVHLYMLNYDEGLFLLQRLRNTE